MKMNPHENDERSWSREESSNPIISVQGALRRPSTSEEIEARKKRLSSSEQERHSFAMAPPNGLSSAQAADLLKQYGRNELEDKKKSKILIFLEQLNHLNIQNLLLPLVLRMLLLKLYNCHFHPLV